MELTVIIPAFNEATRLPATLRAIAAFLPTFVAESEVLVVEDGSTDGTSDLVRSSASAFAMPLRVLSLKTNQGKGAAVRAGVAASQGRFILIMDADSATPITELPRLWMERERAAVILGSRYLPDSHIHRAQPLARRVLSRLGNLAIRLLVGLQLTDTQNGFKLFAGEEGRAIFRLATIDRWGFDIEVLAIAQRRHRQILEVPVAWSDAAGSKLRAGRDALRTLKELLRIRSNLNRGVYDAKPAQR